MPARTVDDHEITVLLRAAMPRLWVVAMAIVSDRDLADDLVQDCAVIAWRKRQTFESGTNFQAWTSTIMRNLARRARRKKIHRRAASLDAVEEQTASPAALDVESQLLAGAIDLDGLGLDDSVARGLRNLDETARLCLLLRVVSGLPYDEIADIAGVPAGTAMSHVHRSRKRLLHNILAERGGETYV